MDFSSRQNTGYWENFEQENNSTAINVLFVSHNSEKVKVAYKSNYNKHKNQVILLMKKDEANNYYYFAVKDLLELNSSRWLQGKNNVINFQNALNHALNYQTIENNPQRISPLKPYYPFPIITW